jgi:hypothetical protein
MKHTGWRAFGVVLALTVAGCSDNPTNPGTPIPDDGLLANPQAVVQAMDVLISTLETEQFRSLEALDKSAAFDGLTGQVAAVTAGLVRSAAGEPRTKLGNGLASLSGASYSAMIPLNVLGTTFEWDTDISDYADLGAPGAPANGIRIVLYVMDPDTGIPVMPLIPVGYLQIEVTSSSIAAAVVGSTGVPFLAYQLKVTGPATMEIQGFVSNGTNRADLTALYEETINDPQPMFEECADMAYTGLCADTGFNFDIALRMSSPSVRLASSGSVELVINYDFMFNGSGWVITTETANMQDGQLLTHLSREYFEAIGFQEYLASFDVSLLVDGVVVGAINATADPIVFTGVDGIVLTEEEFAAVASLFGTSRIIIAAFAEMMAPVTAIVGLPLLLPPLGG